MNAAEVYVIVDVGCIECGETTKVVGVYTDPSLAEAEMAKRAEELGEELFARGSRETAFSYFTGGQRCMELHRAALREAA